MGAGQGRCKKQRAPWALHGRAPSTITKDAQRPPRTLILPPHAGDSLVQPGKFVFFVFFPLSACTQCISKHLRTGMSFHVGNQVWLRRARARSNMDLSPATVLPGFAEPCSSLPCAHRGPGGANGAPRAGKCWLLGSPSWCKDQGSPGAEPLLLSQPVARSKSDSVICPAPSSLLIHENELADKINN